MPRESVRAADYHFEGIASGYEPKRGESAYPPDVRLGTIDVGWGKYPQGQVEVCTSDQSMLASLIAQMEEAEARGDDIVGVVKAFFNGSGFWVTLDRDKTIDLIHLLRKASTQAFRPDA